MRVCRVTDSFPPPWKGLNPGPYELSLAQQEAGLELEIIAKWQSGSEIIDNNSSLTIHRIKGKHYAFEILAISKLLRLHRKNKFDIIHAHGSSLFLFYFLRRMLRINLPVAVSVHCVRKAQRIRLKKVLPKEESLLGRLVRHEAMREGICFLHADILLPVGDNLKQEIIDHYHVKEEKLRVIGNGVNVELFNRGSRTENAKTAKSEKKEKIILYVGVLNGRKNEKLLIQAFSHVIKIVPDSRLVIVGEGSSLPRCREMVHQMGLEAFVHFTGYVSYENIAYYYQSANIFVLPSFYEGLPKVLLEAMGCGKAVIASDIPGIREVITHGINGLLFDPHSLEQLVKSIIVLLKDDPYAVKMGERGRELILNKYTWRAVAFRCNEIYDMLLNKNMR